MLRLRKFKASTLLAGLFAGAALGILPTIASADSIPLVDPGFQLNNVSGGYAYPSSDAGPGGPPTADLTGWTYVGGAGVAANESAFGVHNAFGGLTPDGSDGQAGFVQGGPGSSISQTFTDNLAGSSAVVSFWYEGRSAQDGPNTVLVNLTDNTAVTLPLSQSITPTGAQTTNFTEAMYSVPVIEGDQYTLAFIGQDATGDHTTFIDNVSVNVVPLPAAATAGLVLLFGIASFRGVRRYASLPLMPRFA